MKALLLILLSLTVVNCGNKSFSKDSKSSNDNVFVDDHNDDQDDDDDNNDDNKCPRYDLVVTSAHTSNKKLNFKYTFNAEMTHTSIQGKHKINFSKAQYNSCSGSYTNTNILASLIPLQVTEDLTGEVLVTDGQACSSTAREVNIQVLDGIDGTVLFDENNLRNDLGCEFGYTADGEALRAQLIQLADGVANAKGAACN